MDIKNRSIYIIFIAILGFLMGCGDMPHDNPLDPENPNYKPPPAPTFASIALQNGEVWFGSSGGGLVAFDGIKWSKYTKADGLPGDNIEAVVAQGSNIWFGVSGSNQKVYRFDGAGVKGYSTPPVISLSADENHIWMGSENEIGTYDPGRDSLIWYQLPAGGQVIALLWDGVSVWVALARSTDKVKSVEIAKFTPQTGEWDSEGIFPLVNDETILAIALDGHVLWGGTSRGDIRQFEPSQEATSRTQVAISPPGVWKTDGCIAVDEGFVWFGYGSRGLIRYDKISGERKSFYEGESVYGIAVSDEYVWVVTTTGAHRYEKRSSEWKQYNYPSNSQASR